MAESSPNNPLKVLHRYTELEDRKLAFVGISNFRLDVSKMSRVVYVARFDQSEEDLTLTAEKIF